MGHSRHSQSNPIELNFNRTQSNSIELNSWIEFDWVRQSNEIELTEKKKNKSNPIERSIFELVICVKEALKIHQPDLGSSSYFNPECSARVFRKRRNSAEMASDALWIVSFRCVVKGYQKCRFDVKDGEVFKVLKKISETDHAFRIANEHGQLGHLQRVLFCSVLWGA